MDNMIKYLKQYAKEVLDKDVTNLSISYRVDVPFYFYDLCLNNNKVCSISMPIFGSWLCDKLANTEEWLDACGKDFNMPLTKPISMMDDCNGKQLLSELLNEQEEVISSSLRFNGVHVEKIKQVFQKHGIKIDNKL